MGIEKELSKNIIAEIKKADKTEKIKLMGLFELLTKSYEADENYEKKSTELSYRTFTKQKELFARALSVYKGENKLKRENLKDIDDFFSKSEIESEKFEDIEVEGVVSIWPVLLERIEIFKATISEQDKNILKYVKHIEVFKNNLNNDVKVEFTFEKNEYFTNEKVEIEVLTDEGDESGDQNKEIRCKAINWNAEKDPRFTKVTVKGKGKKGRKEAVKTKKENKDSFFWIFGNYKRPDEDEEEEYEEEEEQDEFSARNLFFKVSDILSVFQRDLYEYAIPAIFGLNVDQFQFGVDFEEADGHEGHEVTKKATESSPECKQQ
jgi:hypothetical protein